MSDDTQQELTCYLPASGFTRTHNDIHSWAGQVVLEAKKIFGEASINAGVWSYREQGREFLSCDLHTENNEKCLPIIICAEGEHDLPEIKGCAAEADTYDMAEAVHLVGLITAALKATITVGRQVNELNTSLLDDPLKNNKTNGFISLSFNESSTSTEL